MEVTIRAYDPRDAADLADVFFRSVRQVALSDYTAAQVRAWAPEPRTAEWADAEASDGRLVLVAVNEGDRPVAYIDLEPNGHINRLFCGRRQPVLQSWFVTRGPPFCRLGLGDAGGGEPGVVMVPSSAGLVASPPS